MKKLSILVCLTALLSSCGHQVVTWEKAGATDAEYKAAKYACEKDAVQSAPVTVGQVAQSQARINKNAGRSEMQMGAVDMNQGNRASLFADCMGAKGWSHVTTYYDKNGNLTNRVIQ